MLIEGLRCAALPARPPLQYLPIGGKRQFCEYSVALAYGEDAKPVREKSVAMVQALSGTGACRCVSDCAGRGIGSMV